jgi:quinol monooxygenase YgiN
MERAMELAVFARFHARAGEETAVAAAIRDVVPASRAEPGCRAITAYVSVRDPRLFWIHSRWVSEAAFAVHADLPHTRCFLERVEKLIEHPLDITRSRALI